MVYVARVIRIYSQLLSDANAATARVVAGVFTLIRVERPILVKPWKSKRGCVAIPLLLAAAIRCALGFLIVSARSTAIAEGATYRVLRT